MPPENEGADDHSPSKGLEKFFRNLEPALKGFAQLGERVRPFTELMGHLTTAAEPFFRVIDPFLKKWSAAEALVARGWVPSSTTPFDLVEDCGDDAVKLERALLAHYDDNWRDVRERLEASVLSRDIDDEAKTVFREALDAHERGFYRSVSRLLFPEFERMFRQAFFEGKAGQVAFGKLIGELAGDDAGIAITDFFFSGIQDVVLYKYVTEGARGSCAPGDRPDGPSVGHTPGLGVMVSDDNLDQVRLNPIPTRHAVAHGLVAYSSQQSSLNAIFIAEYVFSVMSEMSRKKAKDVAQAV